MNLHTVEEICKMPFDTWNWARGGYIKKGKIGLINTDGELGIEIDIDKGTVKQNKKSIFS